MEIFIEKLIAQATSKYALGMMIAKRAKEVTAGAKVYATDISGKPDMIAMREMTEGKIKLVIKPKVEKPVAPAEQAPVL
ncbi:MAG: DNA-directed RNA polymerase subunit omega [Candidatus Hydrogenedentota bacterium]